MLYFFVLCIPAVCAHRFTIPIGYNPGLYFDKLLDVKFNNDYWNVVVYANLGDIKKNLKKIDSQLKKNYNHCSSITSRRDELLCFNTFKNLGIQHNNNVKKFTSLSYLTQTKETSRLKRALVNTGGTILKSIFGTLDSNDASKFSNAINKVESREVKLATLMDDKIQLIKSDMFRIDNTLSELIEHFGRLNESVFNIDNKFDDITNKNYQQGLKSHLTLVLSSLESTITTLSIDIDNINNAILFSKVNILHPSILSPVQLFQELQQHSRRLPPNAVLPITLSLKNIYEIINISEIMTYFNNKRLILVLKIPLVLTQIFNLFQIIPIPIRDIQSRNEYIQIIGSKEYLAITQNREKYTLIENLEKCKVIKDQVHTGLLVCKLSSLYSVTSNPICETILLTEVVSRPPNSCQIKGNIGPMDFFKKITRDRWIYVQTEPSKCNIYCADDGENYQETLQGTGILELPKSCRASVKSLTFVPNAKIYFRVNVSMSDI